MYEEDNHYYDYLQEEYEERIRDAAISDYLEGLERSESAQKILDYLPIRRNTSENAYISHLWGSFTKLDSGDDEGRPFSIMPFHLLFMLALQYKALRISIEHQQATDLFYSGAASNAKQKLTIPEKSAFDLALVRESTLTEVFQLVGVSTDKIQAIKGLINKRNDNLAHAKGGIETDIEKKIDEYLVAIESVQVCFVDINNGVAKSWGKDIRKIGIRSKSEIDEFVESRLLDSQLCVADFRTGLLQTRYSRSIIKE